MINTSAGSKALKLEEIPDTSQRAAPVRYRPAPEQNTWSSAMRTLVSRTDNGESNHFIVEFVVPNPPTIPGPPMNYPFNLITVYGFQISGMMRNDLPLDTVPSRTGSWKPGEKVTLEFDLPKQFADPTLGWDLRFCAGSKAAGCLPSPNLLQGFPI